MKAPKASVQYPYRAVICGEEHIVQGWRDGNLLTDKGEFVFSRLHGKQIESEWAGAFPGGLPIAHPVQSTRLLEVAMLRSDGNGGWLLNEHNLAPLEFLPAGCRLKGIKHSEILRVHKGEIHALAWVQAISAGIITSQLDRVLADWKSARQFGKANPPFAMPNNFNLNLFGGWSYPIWLTAFHGADKNSQLGGDGKALEASERTLKPKMGSVLQAKTAESLQPPEIDETLLWHVQQRILDKIDSKLRSAPSASQVFVAYCRDRLTLADIKRRHPKWAEGTIKLRIKTLRPFLKKEFNGLTLEGFFVDRAIFNAAEKQLTDYRARRVSPSSLGE